MLYSWRAALLSSRVPIFGHTSAAMLRKRLVVKGRSRSLQVPSYLY